MKFLIKPILVSFIGTIAMFGALGSDNQWPGLIVAFAVWIWFIYSLTKPSKSSLLRERENQRQIQVVLRRLEQ